VLGLGASIIIILVSTIRSTYKGKGKVRAIRKVVRVLNTIGRY
jgi:hypothetical protein